MYIRVSRLKNKQLMRFVMYERQLKLPFLSNKSFFLFGARGTGKTLWVTTHAKLFSNISFKTPM